MKQTNFSFTILGVSLCLAAGLLNSRAAVNKTWDGGGDQSTWSASPANWDNDTAPVAGDFLFFDGGTGLSPNNDFAANTAFAGLTFNSGAGAFTIGGNTVNMTGGVTNNSPNLQTLNLNLNNTATRTYNAAAGPIVCAGVVTTSIIKEGTNSVTFLGGSGNSGVSPTINNGILILAKGAGQAVNGTVLINTNGILRTIGTGTYQDQIHFNQRIVMNGGRFQLQHVDSVNTIRLEEIASLSGSNANSIVENGLPNSTNRLDIGGGNGHRGIYSGTIGDGAGVFALRVYRNNNLEQLNGTNTYSGTTQIENTTASGSTRLIVNGQHTGGGAYSMTANAADRFAYLNGNGIISASVINVNAQSLIGPGGALSADLADSATFSDSTALLTISNAVNLNTSSSSLEIQISGTTAGSGYDQLVIAGSGTFSNNSANLKLPTLGYTPATGDKFTIVKVEGTDSSRTMGVFGSLNGSVTDLSQGATFVEPSSGKTMRISYRAEGTTFDAGAGNGNDIMLEVVAATGGTLAWRGDVNNLWNVTTTANWRNSGGTATTFTNGDNVTFNNSGSNNLPIDLATDLSPGNILVDATKDYVFATSTAGKLAGTIVLTKTNTGTLTILTDNNNAGSTLVRQGTLRIGTNGTSGLLSGALDIRTNATVIFDRSDTSTSSSSITGGGTLIQNGTNGTLILTANSTFNGGTLVNAGTLQFGDGSGVTGSIQGTVTNNATVTYNFNNAVTIFNNLSGTGVVNLVNSTTTSRRFTFPTTLTNYTFSGTFNVGPSANLNTADQSSGTNQLGIGSTVYVQDTGSVYLDRNGIYLTTLFLQGAGNGAGSAGVMTLEIEQGANIVSNVNLLADATIGGFLGDVTISGRILGTAGTETLTFANRRPDAQSYNLRLGSAAGPNNWGPTIIEPGDNVNQRIRVTALASRAISTNTLTIGAHGIFQLNGFDHTVASLASGGVDGAFLPSVFNGNATNAAVFSVGTDGSSTTFDGVFGNGGGASLGVTKVGAGTLTLSGSSSNTGPVTVSGGTVALTGEGGFSNATQIAIGTGSVLDVTARSDASLNLNSGQTLKGSGGLTGNLVTLPGSIVNPGLSLGTLTVSSNATLGGTLLMEINRASSPNSDHLNVVGTLTAGGTLQVTNIGAAMQVNDTFPLFSTGVSGFTVNLPSNDPVNNVNYTWQNNVAANGSVKVLSVTASGPPALSYAVSGNTINFSWSGAFKLQAQTNGINVGISTNWADYPSGGSSPVNVTINPANQTVFFRLAPQ